MKTRITEMLAYAKTLFDCRTTRFEWGHEKTHSYQTMVSNKFTAEKSFFVKGIYMKKLSDNNHTRVEIFLYNIKNC